MCSERARRFLTWKTRNYCTNSASTTDIIVTVNYSAVCRSYAYGKFGGCSRFCSAVGNFIFGQWARRKRLITGQRRGRGQQLAFHTTRPFKRFLVGAVRHFFYRPYGTGLQQFLGYLPSVAGRFFGPLGIQHRRRLGFGPRRFLHLQRFLLRQNIIITNRRARRRRRITFFRSF